MKLSHRQLEQFRSDPAAFVGAPSIPSRARFGKQRALQLAIFRYHRSGGNIAEATSYLGQLYRRFKNRSDLSDREIQLREYVDSFLPLGNTTVSQQLRLAAEVCDNLELTGEISRLDLVPSGGYAVWLFTKERYSWSRELRMPLLQRHFAEKMKVPNDQVRVGFYAFDVAAHESHVYQGDEIQNAIYECRALIARATVPS